MPSARDTSKDTERNGSRFVGWLLMAVLLGAWVFCVATGMGPAAHLLLGAAVVVAWFQYKGRAPPNPFQVWQAKSDAPKKPAKPTRRVFGRG